MANNEKKTTWSHARNARKTIRRSPENFASSLLGFLTRKSWLIIHSRPLENALDEWMHSSVSEWMTQVFVYSSGLSREVTSSVIEIERRHTHGREISQIFECREIINSEPKMKPADFGFVYPDNSLDRIIIYILTVPNPRNAWMFHHMSLLPLSTFHKFILKLNLH